MGAYLIVLFVLLVGTLVVRHRMLRGPVPVEPVQIDPYVAADLTGGPDRVALTVLTEMVDEHRLAVDRKGRVTVEPGDAVVDPMRVAVLRGFRDESTVRASTLYHRACRQREMRRFEAPAVQRGLRYEPAHRRMLMLVPLPLAVVAWAGIPLVFVEIASGGPGTLLVIPLIIIIGVVAIMLIGTTPKATPMGRQALKYVTTRSRRAITSRDAVVVDGRTYSMSAYAVATLGSLAVRDHNLDRALFPPD